MDNIKEIVDNQKSGMKKVFYNYTITLICVAIISILCCFDANYGGKEDIDFLCFYFLLIFGAGSLFVETFFVDVNRKKPIKKLVIGYIISAILALGWTLLYAFGEGIEIMWEDGSFSYNLFNYNMLKLWYVFLVSMILLSLYKLIKKSGLNVNMYLGRAFIGVLMVIAVNIILVIALEYLLDIFDRLILEISYWDYYEAGIKLLGGFVVFPYCLYKLTDTKEDNSTFTKNFVNYVLSPCVIIAIALVYIYIIKALISWESPNIGTCKMCISIFVIGAPIELISYGFIRTRADEQGVPLSLYGKLVKSIKYAYIPLIILEIVALATRISNYGLTEKRYLGVVIIIFQLIYVLWELIGKILKIKIKEEELIIVAVVLYAVTLLAPFINYDKLSYVSQKDRFEVAMESEDYVTAEGSLNYLMFNKYGADYIRENYTPEERRALNAIFDGEEENIEEYRYYRIEVEVYSSDKEEGIDVEGYSKNIPFKFESEEDETFTLKELENISIKYGKYTSVLTGVNIRPVVENYATLIDRDAESVYYNCSMHYEYVEVDDNTCVVIEKIEYEYNPNINQAKEIKIKGYVLVNEKE